MGNPRLVVIIHTKDLPVHFWGNTMNTICYTNKICVKLTRYLMSSGKKKKKFTIRLLCVFRGKCCTCILRGKENLAKLDSKSDEEICSVYVSIGGVNKYSY